MRLCPSLPARGTALAVLLASCGGETPAPAPPASPPAPAPAVPAPPRDPRTPGHLRMLAMLREVRDRTADENEYQGDFKVRALKRDLDALPPDATEEARWRVLSQLGEREVLIGREREGIDHMLEARRLLPAAAPHLPPDWPAEFLFRTGVCWLRLGEKENCCARSSPESCILPLRGRALHELPEGSREAKECLLEVLRIAPPDSPMQMQAIWLLNIAAMTLGEYPAGVPAEHRIPPEYFASEERFPRFENVAPRLGLDTFSLSGGTVAEDFDLDGDLDLLVSRMETDGPIRYWRNGGDGTFSDRTKAANLEGIFGGLNMVQADYDNDGWTDVLVLRGGWFGTAGRHPRSLLRNNGDGTFTDAAFDAGLADALWPSQTAAWGDFDNDGDLDLFVGNETTQALASPCQLFRNEGNGRFRDVAGAAGVTNDRFTKGCGWGDVDGDGFPDLYVSNLGQPNRLYRNRRDGTFQDTAEESGVAGPLRSFPCWFWDFDGDGVLDLFAAAFPAAPADLAAAALGKPCAAEPPGLYRGDGKGGFRNLNREWNLRFPNSPMGCNFGDLDNDGRLDFYLATGNTGPRDLMPNLMFRNQEGRRFVDVTLEGGFGHLQKGHGVAFADLDDDGDQDVFAEMGGAYLGDRFHDVLFENPGFGNRWLEVRLVGVRSNRSAIGARIRAEFEDGGERRTITRWVGSGGSFGCNPLRQHLGLGKAARVDLLEVHWPTTGRTQVFRDLPVGRFVEITEGDDRPRVTERRPVRLGGGKR